LKIRERSHIIITIIASLLVGIGIGLIIAASFLPNVSVASAIITWSGAAVGIITLVYQFVKDFINSRKRATLAYGNLRVRNLLDERQSKRSTYLLEIENTNKNTVAQDCKCFINLSELGLARLIGKWFITDEESIPIAHTEMIALFTRVEDKLIFFSNVGNSIRHPEFALTDDIRKKNINIQIQSTNADFPTEKYSKTIEFILQKSESLSSNEPN
jgi:hypothetical protein